MKMILDPPMGKKEFDIVNHATVWYCSSPIQSKEEKFLKKKTMWRKILTEVFYSIWRNQSGSLLCPEMRQQREHQEWFWWGSAAHAACFFLFGFQHWQKHKMIQWVRPNQTLLQKDDRQNNRQQRSNKNKSNKANKEEKKFIMPRSSIIEWLKWQKKQKKKKKHHYSCNKTFLFQKKKKPWGH